MGWIFQVIYGKFVVFISKFVVLVSFIQEKLGIVLDGEDRQYGRKYVNSGGEGYCYCYDYSLD